MARRLLINAVDKEECRVAITEDHKLLELEVERADTVLLRGNIYKASITRIEPSLQAAFLDIGAQRNGFLQINDVNPAYFRNNDSQENESGGRSRPAIQNVLSANQNLVVQVVKDEREAKGATLTTNLSLPGRYLVLMVGNQRGGVSRKIADEQERRKLRQSVDRLIFPPGMGVIVRTAGINRSIPELQQDLDGLLELWYNIVEKSLGVDTPILLYEESDLAIRTIRDYFSEDIEEILIDDRETYDRSVRLMTQMMPSFVSRVVYYDKPQPLFSAFLLDKQVEATDQSEVILPSGGSIVINVTEAIVAIDVNSGRSTRQADVEETAYNTNLEASNEIARQLRLRDLGGLIVVDFIDMYDKRHKQGVEREFRDAVRYDKAKVEIGRISKFGLLELSRQRLRASLVSQSHIVCPHCSGRGRVKTADSAALEALRKIQSAAFAGGVERVRVRMAPSAALFLLNNKRHALSRLEDATGITILVYADGRMKPEEYALELDTGNTGNREIISPAGETENRPAASSGSTSSSPNYNRQAHGPRQHEQSSRDRHHRGGGGHDSRRNQGGGGKGKRNRRNRRSYGGGRYDGSQDNNSANRHRSGGAPAESGEENNKRESGSNHPPTVQEVHDELE